MELVVMAQELAVSRIDEREGVASWAWDGDLVSITRARGELSVICAATAVPAHVKAERGWRALVVTTEMDFETTGVAAAITAALARAGISVLPVATYDTDYFLVRADRLADAIEALIRGGHTVVV